MFLNDRQIRERCQGSRPMIEPFIPDQQRFGPTNQKLISFGLTSRGYDCRLDYVFLVPRFDSRIGNHIADPKNADISDYQQFNTSVFLIPPGRFVLAQTIERFIIPRDIFGVCWNKSTYARNGIVVGVTPLEPEWEGHLTIELSNTHEKPVPVYAGEGICQITFDCNPDECEISYGDRKGKYMGQVSPTVSKV